MLPAIFAEGNCRVIHGRWYDPYTNSYFSEAGDLDIDHIVPLKEAHISGGDDWSREKKKEFANDPENLIPVKASANRSKGSRDPIQWIPSNDEYLSEYLYRWVSIKRKYSLEIDDEEKAAIIDSLVKCKNR